MSRAIPHAPRSPMPLQIDDRIGSADLLAPLQRLGLPCTLARLPFADVAFVGRGRHDQPWTVGIELKTIGDLVSCMSSGRFAGHQLPGLLDTYDDVWIGVEGRWRARPDGVLEVEGRPEPRGARFFPLEHGRQRWMYRDVVNYLHSITMLAGVRVMRTETRAETARWIVALYRWWTNKTLDQHTSLQAFAESAADTTGDRARERMGQPALLYRPSFARRVYKELPGVGWDRSREIERRFPTVFEAIMASTRDWAEIPGVGKVLAERLQQIWLGAVVPTAARKEKR